MIKNFLKKILSFAVLISMLFSSIGTVDTAYAADLSGITRSEWVSKLVSTFNMQVDDESNMPDNYFNDITSDMDCYKDILLAVEFGVIDLEAGQSFRPDDPATREFAAQTLNYCLGFKLDEGIAYTFNDSANVTYKDDAQVALNRGWFSLSNGKFCPEQAITESEMNTMLSDAVSVISGDAVSGTKNIFGVADGVIVVPETATVSIDNNGILTIGNYEGTLQTGDIFVVTLEGFPVAFQAVDVQQSDAGFIIETETNEDTDNAITSIQNEGTSDFDLEQFEVAEGATYRIVDESKGRSAGYETLSIEPYSIKYDKKSKKLTITESVKLNNVAAGTLTVAMKNIKIEQEINSGNQYAYVSMTADTDITASVKFNLNTYSGLPNNLLLGSINVGPAQLSVLMEYDLSGGMAASWSGDLQVGVSYRNGNMRFLNSFHKKEFSMTSEVKLKAGVKAVAEFNFVMIKGNFWASTGVKGGFTYKVYDADTPHTCTTIYGYLYVDTGYNVTVKIVGQKKEWNKTIEVYNIKNSPVRTVYHYEDDILVSSCTRGLSEAAYLTSPHSRYFSSLPGYGSSSYNWGEESVATYSYKVETDSDTGKDYASITGYTGNPSVLAIPETLDGYTVKKIAKSAFQGKTSLKAVTIPDTVTKIGFSAFSGCTNLSDVSLSKNLESIGCRAFASCSSLIEIEIPKSLRSASVSYYNGVSNIVGGPFYNSGLTSVTFETGTDKVVGNLFHYAEKLENVALLDTMTTIGDSAFYGCKSLREIRLPNKLTAIEEEAFKDCTALKSIDIPDTVTRIGFSAFSGCTNLSDVSLSKNLESIGCRAFASCSSLIEIEIPKSLRSASVSYYNGVSNIVGGPFYNSGLTSVTFETGTDKVVGNLFHYAEKLENVALLDTMTTIGDSAFYGCKSLREIRLPNKLTAIEEEAFKDCTALKSIDIPDTVTRIGFSAFSGCTNLSDVSLSKNLESIGCRAFASCSSLIEIEIPKSLRSASVSYYNGVSNIVGGPFYNSGLTSVTFGTGTDKVVGNLFHYAKKLENVALLDTMTTIGDNAFYECKSLREIKLLNKLTAIGAEAFEDCTALESIDIPDTVTAIGTRAFDGCNSLAAVKLSEKLKTIPSYAFNGCSSLTAIKLPENLNSIEANAFQGSGLQAVTIPASCAAVGSYAFAGCKGLATVTLQQGVKTIGSYCFNGCTALENVAIADTVEAIGAYAFYNCDMLSKVVIPNSVTSLGNYIFANNEKLAEVKLGTGLTAIPQYAFYECPALKSISIPYRITTIGTKAFANCTGLAEITIPQSVTSISSDAFSYPKNMTIYGVSSSKAETFANDKGINFVAKSISATNVSLNKTELTLKKGETATLVASITPENFTDTISWRSTDTKVATVTDAGLVKGVAVGTAKIKVTVGSTSALCTVNVIQPVTSISLNRTSLTMDALDTYQLTATASPATAVNREITWSSSDSAIASVDENGLVTAHKKGTATIKATAKDGSNISNSCKVTVSNNGYEVSKISEFECNHPYSNNCSDIWVYTVKGATYLDLVFDAETNIEEDFDFLYIYDANGSLIGKYTGTSLAGETIRVPGDTAKIKLISDEAGSTWGFRVTEVKTDAAEGGIKGDINGDGSITAADMQRLYNHLNGTALLKDASIADLNEDGNVTAADMQRLYNHLNGTALLK